MVNNLKIAEPDPDYTFKRNQVYMQGLAIGKDFLNTMKEYDPEEIARKKYEQEMLLRKTAAETKSAEITAQYAEQLKQAQVSAQEATATKASAEAYNTTVLEPIRKV